MGFDVLDALSKGLFFVFFMASCRQKNPFASCIRRRFEMLAVLTLLLKLLGVFDSIEVARGVGVEGRVRYGDIK